MAALRRRWLVAGLWGEALVAVLASPLRALLVFGARQPIGPEFPVDLRRWLRQSLLVAAGSALVLVAG